MNRRLHRVSLLILLTIAMAACASPVETVGPQPSSQDAATALPLPSQAPTNEAANTPTNAPEVLSNLLPRSLYFLGNDSQGISQVYLMERDGKTVIQLTFEPVNVTAYDVALVDGSIAYGAGKQLLLADANGSNRRLLVDGSTSPDLQGFYSLVFSPDGQTLAYAHEGLNLYDVSTGVSEPVPQNAFSRPVKFSPDSTKLLITVSVPNTDATHDEIYYPATNSIVRFKNADGSGTFFCCGNEQWTQDSLSFYVANPTVGMLSPGLWKVDAASGTVTTLLPMESSEGNFNLADEPYLAPDGRLYYFFLESKDAIDGTQGRAPLQLVRSAPDGVAGRTILRPDTFELMTEALWAPDASFVVVAFAPNPDIGQGGQTEVVYFDGRPNVALNILARQLKWGP